MGKSNNTMNKKSREEKENKFFYVERILNKREREGTSLCLLSRHKQS